MLALLLLACGKDASGPPDSAHSEHSGGDDSEDPPPVLGCIVGVARDDSNVGEPKAPVQAWSPGECELLSETETDLGGGFCLDGVRVGGVEVQVSHAAGRCAWVHSHTVLVEAEGDCSDLSTCLDVGTWFECYADTAVCGTE
jgi:hypothetical protein